MQITATIDTNAVAQIGLRRYLRTMDGRSQELYPVWDKVLNIIYEAEQRLFEREGRTSEHGKWEKLSPRYAAWKKKHYPGMPILTLTGRFNGSMTDPSGRHADIRERQTLTWGSAYEVSGGYDLGGIHAEGHENMPAREPIRVTQRNVDDIANTVVDYILDFDLSRPRQAWEMGY